MTPKQRKVQKRKRQKERTRRKKIRDAVGMLKGARDDDGVKLVTGRRFLFKTMNDDEQENGIYKVTVSR